MILKLLKIYQVLLKKILRLKMRIEKDKMNQNRSSKFKNQDYPLNRLVIIVLSKQIALFNQL